MDYKQTLEHLYSRLPMFSRIGAAAYKPGLEAVLALAEYFGNPERKFKSIHVAGTNGKGSSSSLIAASLQAQGYKTGLYTSPHLVDFRERMRINGDMIPQDEVIAFVQQFLDSNYQGRQPSFFELTMMMAFHWFAKEKVDYAVIEVGMGGRLDSTNIITPLLSLITNISFDHTQFLGDTLPKIATEKAGIIKPGIPVVIGEAEGEVKQVFASKAAQENAPITFAPQYCSRHNITLTHNPGNGWNIKTPTSQFNCPLDGHYQQHNIRAAITSIHILRSLGIQISDEALATGFGNVDSLTGFRGRWTILSHSPLTICDTGHNVAGLTHNFHQLSATPHKRLRMILGFVSDKDIAHIIDLLPRDAIYYLTQAQIPRAMPTPQLSILFQEAGIRHTTYPHVADAYKAASSQADNDDIIYIGGSTFIVADMLENLQSK